MPLVAHNSLPTYNRLLDEGQSVLSVERAKEQDIRPLHIGLLNMMPDTALAATERQFFRLVGSSNSISQIYMHPFTIDSVKRAEWAQAWVDEHYEPFEALQDQGLDAIIISGANVTESNLSKEVFWDDLVNVMEWAHDNVASTLCSCLATHAAALHKHQLQRYPLALKRWGAYEHDVVCTDHPLVKSLNTKITVPHSRFNQIDRQQFEAGGMHVLAEGDAGVHLIVSPDGFRTVYFQGHPEYDHVSLMKEHRREVGRYINRELPEFPPLPENYYDAFSRAVLSEYQHTVEDALNRSVAQADFPKFPDELLTQRLHNTWHDSGKSLVGNWVGLVYQLTHKDLTKTFMDGINPEDPLGWLASRS